MKHLLLQIDYDDAWRRIFGTYFKKVKVKEAIRCFKCHLEEFAM